WPLLAPISPTRRGPPARHLRTGGPDPPARGRRRVADFREWGSPLVPTRGAFFSGPRVPPPRVATVPLPRGFQGAPVGVSPWNRSQLSRSQDRVWLTAAGVTPTCWATSSVPCPWARSSAVLRRRSGRLASHDEKSTRNAAESAGLVRLSAVSHSFQTGEFAPLLASAPESLEMTRNPPIFC